MSVFSVFSSDTSGAFYPSSLFSLAVAAWKMFPVFGAAPSFNFFYSFHLVDFFVAGTGLIILV